MVHNAGNQDIRAPLKVTIGDNTWESMIEIDAGGSKAVHYAWTPSYGDYSVQAVLDPDQTVLEIDESNNAVSTIVHARRLSER